MIRGAGRKDRSSGTRVEENSDVTNMRSALFSSVGTAILGERPLNSLTCGQTSLVSLKEGRKLKGNKEVRDVYTQAINNPLYV